MINMDTNSEQLLLNNHQRSFSEIRSTSKNMIYSSPERNHFQRMDIEVLPVQLKRGCVTT